MPSLSLSLTAVDAIAVRRGRREKKKKSSSSALERIRFWCTDHSLVCYRASYPVYVCVYRRERETGVREEGELQAPDQLFDLVTEDEYSRLVQKRQAAGFIMDDGE